MNYDNTTVIICCAGMDTKLGIGSSKSLIDIDGKRLIIRLLDNLKEFCDIRIVVGYQADDVIKIVNDYRKDIMYVFNYDYETTGPAASMSKALKCCNENIIILDGDLVMNPYDFQKIIKSQQECIAYTKKKSDFPILIDIEQQSELATYLNSKNSKYEWPGIVKLKKDRLFAGEKYIYNIVNKILPLKAIYVNVMEVDTPDDYERVINWVKSNYKVSDENIKNRYKV